jgi:low affinity Fe/Cu permease
VRAPRTEHSPEDWFRGFAERTASALGRPAAFLVAFGMVLAWGAAGPAFHYSEAWQIVINTSTTIITFLMVFLLQNTQMRDSRAIHLKLNELLRAVSEARTAMVGVEELSDARINELKVEFRSLAEEQRDDVSPTKATSALAR